MAAREGSRGRNGELVSLRPMQSVTCMQTLPVGGRTSVCEVMGLKKDKKEWRENLCSYGCNNSEHCSRLFCVFEVKLKGKVFNCLFHYLVG